jgi:hypothetical protein
MPPKVPQVYWDGKQLTINSDNSTLADILTAIRNLTGAELDIPTTASRERFAARLGPGPAREVLSTLLSWSDFDYVIQASDANPAGVHSVLLAPRGKNNDVMVAKGGSAENPARFGFRGYTRPARARRRLLLRRILPQCNRKAQQNRRRRVVNLEARLRNRQRQPYRRQPARRPP